MRLPGLRIAVREGRIRRVGADLDLPALAARGRSIAGPIDRRPVATAESDEAAVLFTSGATGPAKGVRYLHRQLRAQLTLISETYRLTPDDRIVAAFAPFALYGPALGIRSAVPDTDVTKPGTLTATALADAARRIGATVVFASPAALRNVLATASALDDDGRTALAGVRLLMSAGAPVPASLLRQLQELLPAAELHTPYGMTEALPITDISLHEIEAAGVGDGVCVGRPLSGVEVRIAPLDRLGRAPEMWSPVAGVTGEVWVRGPHIRESYDARWMSDRAAAAHPGWHRTGDVGRLDDDGRLWIQGRTVHVVATSDGPVAPVGTEQRVQAGLSGQAGTELPAAGVAVVGVGPVGVQQLVVVVAGPGGPLAPAELTAAVRRAAGVPVAAVLVRRSLPVDIRHNSKIDRVAVAAWAADVLAGG
jgi:acyl-CoA synthetase (AMP-forming)/AMP-acid ligase II